MLFHGEYWIIGTEISSELAGDKVKLLTPRVRIFKFSGGNVVIILSEIIFE